MKKLLRFTWRVLRYLVVFIAIVLALMALIPWLFPGPVNRSVKNWANQSLNARLDFAKTHLSFFRHFPALTLSLDQVSLMGSVPFQQDTLLRAREVALGVDLWSVFFDEHIHIDKIFVVDGRMDVQVNEKGEANYNVYKSSPSTSTTNSSDSSSASLKLDAILLESVDLTYRDASVGLDLAIDDLNYKGTGDLDKAIFDLKSDLSATAVDLTFDGQPYLRRKQLRAELITRVNTNSLQLIFEKNILRINKLLLDFTGKFDFLADGYDMDFKVATRKADLAQLVTALPPAYQEWVKDVDVAGEVDGRVTLAGQYSVPRNRMPDFQVSVQVKDGRIKHNKAPSAVERLQTNLTIALPALNLDSLRVRLDSLNFQLGAGFARIKHQSTGLTNMKLQSDIDISIDLASLDAALAIPGYRMAGALQLQTNANGVWSSQRKQYPVAQGKLIWKSGMLQTPFYPQPITAIETNTHYINRNGNLAGINVSIQPLRFSFEQQPIEITADLKNFDLLQYAVRAVGKWDIGHLAKVFSPVPGPMKGFIDVDMQASGNQADVLAKRFQRLKQSGTMSIRDFRWFSSYLPQPMEIPSGTFRFQQDKMWFNRFISRIGKSDMQLDGYVQDAIGHWLNPSVPLHGRFQLRSNRIYLSDFMATDQVADTTSSDPSSTIDSTAGVVFLPMNWDLQLSTKINQLHYGDLRVDSIHSNAYLLQGKLGFDSTRFSAVGTQVLMSGFYQPQTKKRARFGYAVEANDFDIKRAYNEVPLFRQMASAAAYASGIISLNYKLEGRLDAGMKPVLPSLTGGGEIRVRKVKLKGFRLLNTVSRRTGKSEIRDPDLSRITIRSKLANNVLTIDRFKIKMAGFRLRMEGQTRLDGALKLRMRLGLPPLGIIGIPMRVTGTHENPKVKLGRGDSDPLEETADPEEEE